VLWISLPEHLWGKWSGKLIVNTGMGEGVVGYTSTSHQVTPKNLGQPQPGNGFEDFKGDGQGSR